MALYRPLSVQIPLVSADVVPSSKAFNLFLLHSTAATEFDFYLLLVANLTRHMQSKALIPVQAGYSQIQKIFDEMGKTNKGGEQSFSGCENSSQGIRLLT